MHENAWMGWLQLPEMTQADSRKQYGRFRKRCSSGAGILVSSRASETQRPFPGGPVLGARDTAMDRTVPAHRELWGKAKTIKFLEDRGQVAMNTMKEDKARERTEGCHRPLGRWGLEDPEWRKWARWKLGKGDGGRGSACGISAVSI